MAELPDKLQPIEVEVACATPALQRIIAVKVSAGTTARAAVALSRIQDVFPELEMTTCQLGIFGVVVDDERVLRQGDRVEIYRPLLHEPREARRRMAARGATMGVAQGGGKSPRKHTIE